jgi:hypothetical protein
VEGLQIQLGLCLLGNQVQVGAQRCFSNGFGIVVIVLLPFHEGLGVLRWDDPWLKAELAQRSTDKMGAQAGLHPNDARRQSLKSADQRQALDLAANNHLAAAIKANEVKDVLADINTDGRKCLQFSSCGICHGMLLLLLTGTILAD